MMREGLLAGGFAGSRLDRYVLRVDQPVLLDADGFLDVSGLLGGARRRIGLSR